MPINLASISRASANPAIRALIYGEPGIGKTMTAITFPKAVVAQVEVGTPAGVEFDAVRIRQYSDLMEFIEALWGGAHEYKTLVIDSISAFEPMLFAETCARGDEKGPKKNIEDFGYGKGYVNAQKVLSELMDGLNALREERGINIVMVGHSRIRRFDDPESASYDRIEPDVHPKLSALIERDMDCILLMKRQTTIKSQDLGFNKERVYAEGGGAVFFHTESRPAYVAKNRFKLPHKIRVNEGEGYSVLTPHLPKTGK